MIIDTLFIILWILLLVYWFYMLRICHLSVFRFTIPSFVFIAFLVYQYIGLPILYFMLNDYRAEFVTDQELIWQVFIFTSITITLMLVGFIFAKIKFGPLSLMMNDFQNNNNKKRFAAIFRIRKLNLGIFVFGLISASVLVLYLSKIGHIALFTVLGFDKSVSSGFARSAMGNDFAGKYHWYKVFMNDTLVFLNLVAFANYLKTKNYRDFSLFLALFLLACFVMTMAIEKGPIMWFLISLFLVFIVLRKDGAFTIKSIVNLSLFLVVIIALMYVYFMGSDSFLKAIGHALGRLFTGQIQPAYHYLEYFKEHDFLMGRTFPNPRGIFPFESIRLTVDIMNWVHPELVEKGVVGSMPTVFWGEMYANFGVIGVFLPPFFIGFILYLVNVILMRLISSPLTVGLFVWIAVHLKDIAGTSLSQYLLDHYLFIVVSVFLTLYAFTNNSKIRYRKKVAF